MEKITLELIKLSKKDSELNHTKNIRFQMDFKIKDLEIDNKNLKNERQKQEIEFKILLDKFSNLNNKNEFESKELLFLKAKQTDVR